MVIEKITFENGDVYEGEIEKGKPHGKGKYTYKNGDVYVGEYLNGLKHGKGKETFDDEIYEGDYSNGKINGTGKYTFSNGNVYEGGWINGDLTGKGRLIYANGDVYEGDFLNDMRSGTGKYTYKNGDVYEGEYANNKRKGIGKITYANGNNEKEDWTNCIFFNFKDSNVPYSILYEKALNDLEANDYDSSIWVILKLAHLGFAGAQAKLGFFYSVGEAGFEKDDDKAFAWYLKAAQQDHALAQGKIGNCYNHAWGVDYDYSQAFEWYIKAAQQGDIDSQGSLGCYYAEGKGVAQDIDKAIEWFQKAAAQGDFLSQMKLDDINISRAKKLRDEKKRQMHEGTLLNFQENRQIRIFISSTFKDMMNERDYLITRIFPGLRRYCEERDISLFELDLRWGVTQEESENAMTFKICLNEVDNTKPFFIGLLGERYGWVPDGATIDKMKPTNVFEEYQWLLGELNNKKSVTETEIQAGAFLPEKEINAYFYIRSPQMETPFEFREEKGSNGEKMLLNLKEKVRNDKKCTTKDYDSLEQLGDMIENDFKSLVDKYFPDEEHLSYYEKESMQQYAYLKFKTSSYAQNPSWMRFLDDFADNGEKELTITGKSGMGKSSLLASWITDRRNKKIENEEIIFHFTGVSQSEGRSDKIIQRLNHEIKEIFKFTEEEIHDINSNILSSGRYCDWSYELGIWLFKIPEDKKLIIALDSIDCLSGINSAKTLNWIPEYPSNIKWIFSSTSGDKSVQALEQRTDKILILDSLPLQNKMELINNYFIKFSKKLTPSQAHKIASSKIGENPAILTALLDNLRIFGNFDIFDKQIEERLLRDSNESLYELFLKNIESLFNDIYIVKNILSFLAVSQNGLSENEIISITKIPKLYWSQLSNCMRVHLIFINGLVTFSSDIMQNTVKNRYLKDKSSEMPYRILITEYMEEEKEISFERKCYELPFQLLELEKWDSLYNFLLDIKVFNYIFLKDKYELGKYWRTLQNENPGCYTMEKYLELNIEDKDELAKFYIDLSSFINEIICDNSLYNKIISFVYLNIVDYLVEKSDYKNAIDISLKVYELRKKNLGMEHPDTVYVCNKIAYFYSIIDEYEKALPYYLEIQKIFEKLFGEDHLDIAYIYFSIAVCYKAIEDYKSALEFDLKANKIWKNNKENNENNFAVSNLNVGSDYETLGDNKNAFFYYNEALLICEQLEGYEDKVEELKEAIQRVSE